MNARTWKVSEVSAAAHVTVRTLHHYDDIGLLVPTGRSDAGYRLYTAGDLRRLRQILLYRELGFSLEGIRQMLDDPGYDQERALREQRALILEKIARLRGMIEGIDATLGALDEGEDMATDQLFSERAAFNHEDYEDEARERWGQTDAYKESARRTRSYGPEQWAQIKEEAASIGAAAAQRLGAGEPPTAPAAMDVAEEHRQHISRWFYPCDHAMHGSLADMYEADERFKRHYEDQAEGLAAWFAAAIRANGRRAAIDRQR